MTETRAFLHARIGQDHQGEAMQAMSMGLARHGIDSIVADDHIGAEQADFLVWWGDKVPLYLQDKPRILLEAGYINGQSGEYVKDRLRFVSAGWNGLHGRADPGHLDCPPNRWQALGIELKPWRNDGEYWLLCDQHPGDSVAPDDSNWWRLASQIALGRSERAIYRPHPLMTDGMQPLGEALKDASKCVTWSSTCAVEAVISGVPTVALCGGSMAWEVTSHAVTDQPYLGDREQWAYNLAYRQWTHAELADGAAWETLREGLHAE